MTEPHLIAGKGGAPLIVTPGRPRWSKTRRTLFLDHLALTGNVQASCREAGLTKSGVYQKRKRDPGFAADWQAALTEAYHTLELQLLDLALNGEERVVRTPEGEGTVMRQDTGLMLRLLQYHRAAVKGGERTAPSPEALAERAAAARRKLAADLALIGERLGVPTDHLVGDDEEEGEEHAEVATPKRAAATGDAVEAGALTGADAPADRPTDDAAPDGAER